MTRSPNGRSWPLRLIAALALLVALSPFAAGQEAAVPPPQPGAVIEQVRAQLDQIEATLQRDRLDDRTLGELRLRIEPLSMALEQAIAALAPQLAAADARVAQIGPKPADGQPAESAEVAKERELQSANRQKVDEQIKRGRLLQVEATQVGDQITQRRRDQLAQRLFERSRSALDPTLWLDVIGEAPRDLRSMRLLASDWGAVIARNMGLASLGVVALSTLIALLIAWPVRKWLARVGERLVVRQMPKTRIRRSATAMLIVLAATFAPALAALALYWGFRTAGWMPSRIEPLAVAAVWAAGYVGLVHGLMRAVLAPDRPSWRLADLSDEAIAAIKNQPLWCALAFVLGRLVDRFNEAIVASLAASILVAAAFAVLNAATFALALRRIRAAEKIEAAADEAKADRLGSPFMSLLRLLAWAAIAVVVVSAATGYVALAQFLANQVIWIATVLSVLYLLLVFVDDLFTSGLSSETGFGRAASETIGIKVESLEQIGVVLSGVVRVALIGIALTFLLAPWGLASTDVFGWLRLVVSGFTVGETNISIVGVLGAILLVIVGFALTRGIQRWLDKDLLPKTRMDAGLKASINTGAGYLGGLVVIMVAVSYLGFSLDRLAIVAGALSVGIGFGLQAIISNFVSGIILLAERPIKAGDWVVIGTDQGNVRRISVRSTEIELFDRSTLLVPNSDFITKTVKNVTHGSPIGRVQIELSVAADVDPAKVRQVLLEVAKKHSSVLPFPEPQVLFNTLGKAENAFALFASVPSPRQAASVKSDLNFALVKAFGDQGVAIGGGAPPSMVDAMDRIGEVLAQFGPRLPASGETPPAAGPAPQRHDASAAPVVAPPTPEPQTGGGGKG